MAQLLCNNAYLRSKLPVKTEEWLDFAIENNSIGSVFLIVPTGKLVRKLKHLLLKKYFAKYGKPLEDSNIFTLQKFVKFIYSKSSSDSTKAELSDAYRLAIFEDAVEIAELKFFKKRNGTLPYSVLLKLSNVIFGLKEDGITPASMNKRLQKHLENPDDTLEELKYGDIARLYTSYQSLLSDKFMDINDFMFEVNKFYRLIEIDSENPQITIEKTINSIFPKDTFLHFEGFSEFKQPETEFLSIFT
ncbi:MAG: hypothetical protein Q8M94_01685, partial [Ignavibacteria bacterium]|nr:hypothetical protein [Ignavibacteria bacterium]